MKSFNEMAAKIASSFVYTGDLKSHCYDLDVTGESAWEVKRRVVYTYMYLAYAITRIAVKLL